MTPTSNAVTAVPFLDLVRQYEEIKDEVDAAIRGTLSEAAFIGGASVRDFEAAFAGFVGVDHCIGVANGTDAIELVLESLALPPGAEVVVPANTFIASSEAVSRSGLRVCFADVSPDTYVLDPDDVSRRVTKRTAAILAVHLYGHPAPMQELGEIAAEHGLVIIEDAAQAHGARIHGTAAGSLGRAATFSFYPGKNLGAYGDAGAVVTDDPELAVKVRMLANHGRTKKYEHAFEGRNSRLDALQAAILGVKLKHLDKWTRRRRDLAARYLDGLAGVGDLLLPFTRNGFEHVYHLFVVRTDSRDALRSFLADRGIETGIHYPQALPTLAAYAEHPQHREAFRSNEFSSRVLSLPIGESLRVHEVDYVIEAVRVFFGADRR